jgi:hypothetical protein
MTIQEGHCAAHGCPLLGGMSTSTTGGSEWWCFLHFGKNVGQLQAITAEINRRPWISKSITDLRRYYHTEQWGNVYKFAQHELAMNQRFDLQRKQDEEVRAWVLRLEQALEAACGKVAPVAKQERIPEADPMQRVHIAMPEEA